MNREAMLDKLLEAAQRSGLEAAEAYMSEQDSFRASSVGGSLDAYAVSTTAGIGIRAVWKGKLGYASTEAFDPEGIPALIEAVKESAEVNEAPDQDEIFPGEATYPAWEAPETDVDTVPAEEKLKATLALDAAICAADSRIMQTQRCGVASALGTQVLRNTYGLNLTHHDSLCYAFGTAVAKRGEGMINGSDLVYGRMFRQLNLQELATRVAEETVSQLDAAPVPSGEYHVILERRAMADLLATFCGMFSAENAQQNLSLLKGREGSLIASKSVTLVDDPLMPGGLASCPFDAEGSATRRKAVIEGGQLLTLLHSRKTARKQGVATTGNASRGGYASAISVSPTNLYFEPGTQSLTEMMADIGDGLVITDVSGLHAGANPISGDFSLLSKGYVIEHGVRGHSVEQITVAGNFYRLLEQCVAFANDLYFPGSSIGSPSMDAGVLTVAGV